MAMAMADSSSLDLGIGLFGEDVLTEILSRLPVKSAMRFKCVSKFWYALIKSSHLIKEHLQHNHTTLINGNAPLFCTTDQRFEDLETNPRIPILSWISSSNNTNDETTTTTTVVDVPSTDPILHPLYGRINVRPQAVMMGPVNGIYCTNGMHLYNLSLREVKVIPPIPITEYQLYSEAYFLSISGFGYDPNANDYKVIKIICFRSLTEIRNYRLLAESSSNPCCHAFLYSLRSNSWRKFESDHIKSLSRLQLRNASSVSHRNGSVTHWLMVDDADENGFAILSFDFVKEAFLRSSLPEALHDKLKGYSYVFHRKLWRYRASYTITVLNDESIALVIMLQGLDRIGDGFCWEVWVMKEYGVKESWAKLFATGHLPQLYPFLGFANNNREIFFNNEKEQQLVSYDPYRQQTKNLHIRALQVRTYMESLVSIVNGGY